LWGPDWSLGLDGNWLNGWFHNLNNWFHNEHGWFVLTIVSRFALLLASFVAVAVVVLALWLWSWLHNSWNLNVNNWLHNCRTHHLNHWSNWYYLNHWLRSWSWSWLGCRSLLHFNQWSRVSQSGQSKEYDQLHHRDNLSELSFDPRSFRKSSDDTKILSALYILMNKGSASNQRTRWASFLLL
jgi:hypothetical protein